MNSHLTINEEDDFTFDESSASSARSAEPKINTPVATGSNAPKKREPFDIAASDTTQSKKKVMRGVAFWCRVPVLDNQTSPLARRTMASHFYFYSRHDSRQFVAG
ncbi:hypothetical protein DL771_003464 [Monosporascus sp. 5C6A]|nr:hypothetical protein DL771_003464 [Monosporascus sp. 5C6A]